MNDLAVREKVVQQLRELADKVEKSSYCKMSMNDERCSVVYSKGGELLVREPTGERIVNIQLNYLEENT